VFAIPGEAVTTSVRSRLALVVGVLMVAGCSGTDKPGGGQPEASSTATPPPAGADPPLGFEEKGKAIGLPHRRVFVADQQKAYFFEEDSAVLKAVDLASGETRWSWEAGMKTPAYATALDRSLLVVAEPVTVKGSGTSLDRHLMRLTALRTTDGAVAWKVDVNDTVLPEGRGEPVGTADDHVVLIGDSKVVVLDPASGALRSQWSASDKYEGTVLVGDVVVGIEGRPPTLGDDTRVVTGRAVADGRTLWTLRNPVYAKVRPLRPGLAAVVGVIEKPDRGSTTVIVDVATGRARATLKTGYFCQFDLDSVVVCQNDRFYSLDDHVIAMDSATGRTLWEFPAPGRKTPTIALARRGAIYAKTDTGSLILDARSGADKVTTLPFTPDQVVAGYGFTFNDRGGLFVHRATSA
jgi:outer membrane protein assembly factor BamB